MVLQNSAQDPFYMKKKYPIEAFESNIMVPFEDTKMPIPVGYDAYLKQLLEII